MKRKIGIIGTNGLPGKYGGWDQLVIHLTENLKSKYNFIVYTSYTNSDKKIKEYNGTHLQRVPFKANGMQSIPYDIYSMIHAIFNCNVLFICGTSGCIFLPIVRLFGKKVILNPDGQEWKRGKWSKPVQWFLKVSEKWGILNSTNVVADNVKIQEYILDEYKKKSELIEYGGDQAIKVSLKEDTALKYDIKSGNYAFKVCRIEPENNIELIVKTFSQFPEINLVLIGNWNFSDYGKSIREKYKNHNNLKLIDPIYNQNTLDELRSNCGIYIHGHSVGGTNPSLVEAMNLGLNITAFDVSYNRETTENKATYFSNETELKSILMTFTKGNFCLNSTDMLEIAQRRYKWSIITEKYGNLFSK